MKEECLLSVLCFLLFQVSTATCYSVVNRQRNVFDRYGKVRYKLALAHVRVKHTRTHVCV
jgi:hypothetical protein